MKNITRFTFILIIAIGFISNSLIAQEMTTYTWAAHKTKFKVPKNFKLETNNKDEFTGTTGDITMSIYPRKGEKLSKDEMKDAVSAWAKDNKVTDLEEVTELDETKLNGYWGVFQEGKKDDFPVLVMLAVDPDFPDIGLYVWISFKDDEKTTETCIKMLKSFTPN